MGAPLTGGTVGRPPQVLPAALVCKWFSPDAHTVNEFHSGIERTMVRPDRKGEPVLFFSAPDLKWHVAFMS